MTQLRLISPVPAASLSKDEANEVFRERLIRMRKAYPELLSAVGNPAIPRSAFGKRTVTIAHARSMFDAAERIVEAAHEVRNAAADVVAVYTEVKEQDDA